MQDLMEEDRNQNTGCLPSITQAIPNETPSCSSSTMTRLDTLSLVTRLANLERLTYKVTWSCPHVSDALTFQDWMALEGLISLQDAEPRTTPSTMRRKTSTSRKLGCPARPVKVRGPTCFGCPTDFKRGRLFKRSPENSPSRGSATMAESPPSTPDFALDSPPRRFSPHGGSPLKTSGLW